MSMFTTKDISKSYYGHEAITINDKDIKDLLNGKKLYTDILDEYTMSLKYEKESEHKRTIDADELLKRIAEKCKIPSLSDATINGLCGATAIIYDMLIESGQEKDADKESD